MFCRHCGHQISVDSRFCSECGSSTAPTDNNVGVSILGNKNAPIITLGDNNIISQGDTLEQGAEYKTSFHKKTPFKKWTLALTSLLSAVASLATIAPPVKAIISKLFTITQVRPATDAEPVFSPQYFSLFPLFLLASAITVLSIRLFLLTKSRTMILSRFSFLPAITGWDGRINFVKLKGKCPICEGGLRFYNKPTEWVVSPQSGRRSITKRTLAAECSRNSDHWWTIDPTNEPPEK